MKIIPREKRRREAGRVIFLSSRRVSPLLAWGDFHARSRFARSPIPEEKWGTTRSLKTCWIVKPTSQDNWPRREVMTIIFFILRKLKEYYGIFRSGQ